MGIPPQSQGMDKKFLADQTTSFFRSVQHNNLEEVKLALKTIFGNSQFKDLPEVVNSLRMKKSGDTALHICATNGFVQIARYLVEEVGADLEQINLDGKTALHDAAQFSQPEMVDYLLAKGVNVNVVKRADWTPLMLACTKSNLPIVKALVKAGADLTFVNKDGWTCVHIAAREGYTDIVGYLLQSCEELNIEANLRNKKSRNGRRPIHTAVMHGHLDTVKLLSRRITSPDELNEEDNCGSSPLMDACRCGYKDIVTFFLDEIQICPSLVNKNGVGLLHISAEANQPEIVKLLVENYHLDVNQPSSLLSFTPLHWACREGHLEVGKVLLTLGASPALKDAKGRTPQDLGKECQNDAMIAELFQR